MLTLFCIPKSFIGHIGVIQNNALESWTRLDPSCEIILFGDDEGTAETAGRLGLGYVPDVARNDYGTPLLNDVFARAQAMAKYNLLCYINSDIILLNDFVKSAQIVAASNRKFLMVGERQDVDLDRPLEFESANWEDLMRHHVQQSGRPRPPDWIDYFVFSEGLYKQLPPFAIGRTSFDNWLVWKARDEGAAVIDASATVMAIHQNHDYTHHPQGKSGIFEGPEAKINRSLMGGRRRYFTIADATYRLTATGLKRNLTYRSFQRKWKFVTRSLHDWRHQQGLHRANIQGTLQSALGIRTKSTTRKIANEAFELPYSGCTSWKGRNDLPLVSVVIPCRNTAQYLPQAIESVLQQDYPRLECVVMDGASTDETREILHCYEGRLQWRSEPDKGPQDAINKGWKLCRGEILAWLNADDLWEPGAVSKAVSYFLEHPEADVVYGDCGLIGPAGEFFTTMRVVDWDLRYAVEYCDHIIHQAASFMRRSILERVGWLYPKLCHDHELWLRISLVGGKLQRIPALLAHARDRSDNLGNRSDDVVSLKVGLTEKFFDSPGLPPELAQIRSRAMSNAYLACIQFVLKDTLPKEDLRRRIISLVWQAIRADPTNSLAAALRLRRALKHLTRKFSGQTGARRRKSRVRFQSAAGR